mgnify:CR=1 FL=1
MGLTDLIPAPYRWIAGGIAALAVLGALGYGVHVYNEAIREPLKREVKFLTDSIEAQKKQAAEILAAKVAENAQLKDKYDAEAKQKDADFAKTIARFNARGPVGMRDLPAGCGSGSGSAGQAQADSAGAPEKPATERGTGDAPRELVVTEGAVAQILGWYAYGMSCHAEVNAP